MTETKPLQGRIALITGASQGLGKAIALSYLHAGADLMLCARSKDQLLEVEREFSGSLHSSQKLVVQMADVSDPGDAQLLVRHTISELGGCHILVNNAGIYGPMGESESVDWQEWVRAIEINLFGSVLMCRAVVPHFKSAGYGKIIQLSGGGATNPMPRISAYAVSKAAVVRFVETLALEMKSHNIDVNAIAPGALNTRMLKEVLAAGPEKVGQDFFDKSLKQQDSGGVDLKYAADLAVFLASAASDGLTGKLISALWDQWQVWPGHLGVLNNSDAYTLRRITGKDRGLNWGDK